MNKKASQLIEELQELVREHGDRYMTHEVENSMYGMEKVEEVEIVSHHETKYFRIK